MKKIDLAKNKESLGILEQWNGKFESKLGFNFKKIKVNTSFGYTNVLETGPDDGMPIVIFHGAMAGAAYALGELSELPKKRKMYAVNIPGQSTEAEHIRLKFGSGEYTKWIVEVFEKLKIKKACIIGISWGGSVALELAKDKAELIHSLLLVVPGSIVRSPILKGIFEIALPMLRYKLFPSIINRDKAFRNLLTNTDKYWSPYLGDAHKHYNIDFSVPPISKKDAFKDFKAPVFIIAADQDISFPGQKLLKRAEKLFPNYKGGHLLINSKHCPSFKNEDRKKFETILEKGLNVLSVE
jgi:pimeloyl-ACP methyl ester carboxylesterase